MQKAAQLFLVTIFSIALTALPQLSFAGHPESASYDHDIAYEIKGYCPVAVQQRSLVKGKVEFTTKFEGKLYKFANFDAQKLFINNPKAQLAYLDARFAKLMDKEAAKSKGSMKKGSGY